MGFYGGLSRSNDVLTLKRSYFRQKVSEKFSKYKLYISQLFSPLSLLAALNVSRTTQRGSSWSFARRCSFLVISQIQDFGRPTRNLRRPPSTASNSSTFPRASRNHHPLTTLVLPRVHQFIRENEVRSVCDDVARRVFLKRPQS